MTAAPATDDVQAELARLGISVPAEDLPFLQRALERQRKVVRSWSGRVSAITEPALTFRVRNAPHDETF